MEHYALFVNSMYTLSKSVISKSEIDKCEEDLMKFVAEFEILYGASTMTFNVHIIDICLHENKTFYLKVLQLKFQQFHVGEETISHIWTIKETAESNLISFQEIESKIVKIDFPTETFVCMCLLLIKRNHFQKYGVSFIKK